MNKVKNKLQMVGITTSLGIIKWHIPSGKQIVNISKDENKLHCDSENFVGLINYDDLFKLFDVLELTYE